jgi:hypothetical protein
MQHAARVKQRALTARASCSSSGSNRMQYSRTDPNSAASAPPSAAPRRSTVAPAATSCAGKPG